MSLYFNLSACVRATSKFSECTKCVDACPESIQLLDNLPSFANKTGVEAAACIGVCPTEAFSLSDFSTTEFFFTFLDSKIRLISPKFNVPCISVLSVEHLISLALASEESITLDMSSYDVESILYDQIDARIDEANFVLSSFSDKRLETNSQKAQEIKEEKNIEEERTSRRSFLGNASLKGVVKHKMSFDEAVEAEELKAFQLDRATIAKIKEKHLPDKRKILFTTLKHINKPEIFEVLAEEDVSFVSQKYVDDSCTNCQICYRICPTGALSSDGKFSLINFDSMLCVKCRLCHDVCEPDAIKLQPSFEIKEFFETTQRTLAKFTIKRCNECGNNFTYTGGELSCPRCLVEEDEAIFLHTNALAMKAKLEEKDD
ncbi:MAG: Iron-sulfur cluster-binding protein [uncultured Sulfurovum sp.]|uniref:Iron-sulfur cluster-binding protein n=1 Tax=uncultured Sulfurovum sp. TaxID=269237 RepID=A0A6S6SJ01_9BACT|nr:MAG: Iron-sulfur cluster-binding protein [uncultured Sulfurovum sp.]